MKILNFGSLNLDHVFQVEHFVRPGETLPSRGYRRFMGGKGLNQSIALARAGAKVWHAGRVGPDGTALKECLANEGVDTSLVETDEAASGQAIIQVNEAGENAILLHAGANRTIPPEHIDRALAGFGKGDTLLLQNEINAIAGIMRKAAERGMRIVFNPAPMETKVLGYPLELVDLFIMNEIESRELPNRTPAVVTLGERGSRYDGPEGPLEVPARKVGAVDTTAAGDTYIGYLLAAEGPIEAAMKRASEAAAICVSRPGASDSIPRRGEVQDATT